MIRHAPKRYVVRVANGMSEWPQLTLECHSREHAERRKRKLEREGYTPRVEVRF